MFVRIDNLAALRYLVNAGRLLEYVTLQFLDQINYFFKQLDHIQAWQTVPKPWGDVWYTCWLAHEYLYVWNFPLFPALIDCSMFPQFCLCLLHHLFVFHQLFFHDLIFLF